MKLVHRGEYPGSRAAHAKIARHKCQALRGEGRDASSLGAPPGPSTAAGRPWSHRTGSDHAWGANCLNVRHESHGPHEREWTHVSLRERRLHARNRSQQRRPLGDEVVDDGDSLRNIEEIPVDAERVVVLLRDRPFAGPQRPTSGRLQSGRGTARRPSPFRRSSTPRRAATRPKAHPCSAGEIVLALAPGPDRQGTLRTGHLEAAAGGAL